MEGKKNTFFLNPEINKKQINNLEKKSFLLSGKFEINRFRDSLRYLIKQDPSLLNHQIDIVFRDLSPLEEDQQIRVFTEYGRLNHVDIVDQKWWMQFAFFQLSEQSFRLIWTIDNAGHVPKWKAYLLIEMLFDVYRQDFQYTTINHSLEWIDDQEVQKYWDCYSENIDQPTQLTKTLPNSDKNSRQSRQSNFFLGEKQAEQLSQWLDAEKISLRALYQAAWSMLLWRYNDVDELLFAVTNHSGQMRPLHLRIDDEMTFFNLLHQVQNEADQCKLFPFIDNTYVFDHLLHISDHTEQEYDVQVTSLDDIERYKLYIHVNIRKIEVSYCEKYLASMQIEQMLHHVQNILQQVYQNPHLLLQDIEILSGDEKEQILFAFNHTKHPLPVQTVDQLIEQKSIERSNSLAVVADDQVLTYEELVSKSRKLANILQHKGIGRGDIVGLMTKNSPWMFVGILGIMQTGAAYLPIDRKYPQNRINYVLADSGTEYLLSESGVEIPGEYAGEIVRLDELPFDQINISALVHVHQKEDPAYMIYTSGSTGKPKGVLVPHSALLNLVTWHNTYYQVTADDRSTKFAGFGFDASVWEIFPYLVAGATIYIVPDEIKHDLDDLHHYFDQHQITCSFLPTQMAEQFTKQDHHFLRVLLTGGDRLRQVEQQRYQIANNYGPTENAVVTTSGFVDPLAKVISIGKPIFNNQVYILSRYSQLQPIGVPGELYVSGASLATGYYQQPNLTNERFVANPFVSGERMYRTGDLARWLPDGSIEYLGRIDNQVQIRGFRIEPTEIESNLLQYDEVEAAVVTTQPNLQQELSLCAYLVIDSAAHIPRLRSELAKQLPAYMIPEHWMKIDQVPLTANGKIDTKALPKPLLMSSDEQHRFTPNSLTEQKLLQLWTEVLGVSSVNVTDHFFQLGGHSLKATMLISRIRQQWGVKLSLKDFFQYATAKEMASFIDKLEAEEKSEIVTIPSVIDQAQVYYPVSSVQRRLYALQQNKEIGTAYHTPIVWEIQGTLDMKRLRSTIQAIIDRHEVFRTSLCFHKGELVQKIHDVVKWEIELFQARDVQEAKQQVATYIRPFDLEQAPLFRISLVRIASKHHVLVWDMHHLICDGVSTGIMHREFMRIYQGETLPVLPLHYKDYAAWESEQLATDQMQADQKYWLDQFSGEIPVLALLTDFPRPIKPQFCGEKVNFSFDEKLTRDCIQFSLRHNTTLYMMLFAVYNLMLAKYTDQESVVVGSMVAGRSRHEWESVCGMFVNTLPIKVSPQNDVTYVHFLKEVKKQIFAAQEHGEYPFAEIVSDLDITGEAGRNPLFDTVFVAQNMDIPQMQIPGLSIEAFAYEEQHALFDMTWEVIEQDTLQLRVEYNTSLFRCETIQGMIDHFIHLLKQVIAQPKQKLAEIELITADEREQVMSEFNHTDYPLAFERTVVDLIIDQAKKTPDQVAVVAKEQILTYWQLHEQSNQLAHLLRKKGVSNGTIVSILAEASLDLFVSILAVLKAGATYLPIDPAYPKERIRYMLQDSKSSILLAPKRLSSLDVFSGEWVDLAEKPWLIESSQDIPLTKTRSDLAYVIYTSGSTGNPKGVMVSHKALLNLVTWHNQYYQVTSKDRSTKYAGVGFDASVWEIFPYLSAGATIYVVDSSIRHDIDALNEFFTANNITISFLPTALAEAFIQLENHSLRALLVGGDKLRQVKPQTYEMINNYGPTENAVVTTCYQIQERVDQKLPIGKPIFNNQIYIVNQALQLQPIGVPGELCISGDSLASGYLYQDQLTEEKFIPNPFAPGKKMYRTGDLARRLPDGNLEYLGRIDQQVQIRGYRVEVGEIEAQLLAHQAVQEVVVTVHQDENQQNVLCAYLVMQEAIVEHDLRTYLTEHLPEYMIPTYFIKLDSILLTANGKVDRKALPKPSKKPMVKTAYVAPTNKIQQCLVETWAEVLHVDHIGIHDHFFSLGGDSIKAIQIAARLQQYELKITVNDLLEHPTIAELAQYVEKMEVNQEAVEITGVVPLTPIQHWFFEQKFSGKDHWNQAVMIPTMDKWDISAMKRAVQKLVEIHDVLRMMYVENNGVMQQLNRGFAGEHFTVEVFSCVQAADPYTEMEQVANRMQQSLDLHNGPLMRLAVFQTETKHYLLIIIHHLVIDGISWRILLEDFFQAYHACLKSKEIHLPAKSNSFQLWSTKLHEYANHAELLSELPYWQEVDKQEVPSIFSDDLDHCLLKDSATLELTLSKSQTTKLLHDAHRAYRTEINDLLMAALGCAICEWAQVGRMAVDLEGHGRESILSDVDITRTVGWFTSIYPVVFDLQTADLAEMIKKVKERLHQVPNKGIGYGVLRYLTNPEQKKELTFQLQPEISFNYLGQFDHDVLFAGMGSTTQHLGNCFSPSTKMHPLEIYGIVVDNQLQFRFLFHRLMFRREHMQRLVDLYQHFLLKMANHCIAQKESTWTPSDFSANDVSLEELDQFLESLD